MLAHAVLTILMVATWEMEEVLLFEAVDADVAHNGLWIVLIARLRVFEFFFVFLAGSFLRDPGIKGPQTLSDKSLIRRAR